MPPRFALARPHAAPRWLAWVPPLLLAAALIAGIAVLAVRDDAPDQPIRVLEGVALPTDPQAVHRVDLNGASAAELEALPEIGERTAEAILEARAQAPFQSLDDAVDRGVLSRRVANALRDRLEANDRPGVGE